MRRDSRRQLDRTDRATPRGEGDRRYGGARQAACDRLLGTRSQAHTRRDAQDVDNYMSEQARYRKAWGLPASWSAERLVRHAMHVVSRRRDRAYERMTRAEAEYSGGGNG